MNRITIIGGSGSGKTTLATNLSLVFDLPVYHLDALNYFPNWQKNELVLKKFNKKEIIFMKLFYYKKYFLINIYRKVFAKNEKNKQNN